MINSLPLFDGWTIDEKYDYERLSTQFSKVYKLMKDEKFRTVPEIAQEIGGSHTAISARLRDFRKEKYGGHTVKRRRRGDPRKGIFEYSLRVNRY